MTRIDFYILPQTSIEHRYDFACRLVQKSALLGHRLYIHCTTEVDARHLDSLLWQHPSNGFLPHRLVGDAGARCPIEIGYSNEPDAAADHHEVLINLSLEVPAFFSRFERLAEIVVQETGVLEATRQHYRYYSGKNYPLHRHSLS